MTGTDDYRAGHALRVLAQIFPQQEGAQRETHHIVGNFGETAAQLPGKQAHIFDGGLPAAVSEGSNLRITGISAVTPQVETCDNNTVAA